VRIDKQPTHFEIWAKKQHFIYVLVDCGDRVWCRTPAVSVESIPGK